MSEKTRTFESGATRNSEEGKLDYEGFLSPLVLHRCAEYLNGHRLLEDGTTRDSDNWQKGMPRRQYMKSLIRHTWNLWMEWRGQRRGRLLLELLCAIHFNVQGLGYELLIGRDVSED